MTSFILQSVQDRPTSYPENPSYSSDNIQEDGSLRPGVCPFCDIIIGSGPAWKVYEDSDVVAFLDIYPMRTGHTLLIPKAHYARLSDLPPEMGAAMGRALPRITKAITEGTGNKDLNVVCNQGYAQDVQVHWHLIPAPIFQHEQSALSSSSSSSSRRKAKAEKISLREGRPPSLNQAIDIANSKPGGRQGLNKGKPLRPPVQGLNGGGMSEAEYVQPETPTHSWMDRREMYRREFLDDDEADELAERIRSRL